MATQRFRETEASSTVSAWPTVVGDIMMNGASRTNGQNADNVQNAPDSPRERARGVAQAGAEGGKHVAPPAIDQANEGVSTVGEQARWWLSPLLVASRGYSWQSLQEYELQEYE